MVISGLPLLILVLSDTVLVLETSWDHRVRVLSCGLSTSTKIRGIVKSTSQDVGKDTDSRPWLHLVVPAGLNHIPTNHVDYVLPMFSLIKILHGVALQGSGHSSLRNQWRAPLVTICRPCRDSNLATSKVAGDGVTGIRRLRLGVKQNC